MPRSLAQLLPLGVCLRWLGLQPARHGPMALRVSRASNQVVHGFSHPAAFRSLLGSPRGCDQHAFAAPARTVTAGRVRAPANGHVAGRLRANFAAGSVGQLLLCKRRRPPLAGITETSFRTPPQCGQVAPYSLRPPASLGATLRVRAPALKDRSRVAEDAGDGDAQSGVRVDRGPQAAAGTLGGERRGICRVLGASNQVAPSASLACWPTTVASAEIAFRRNNSVCAIKPTPTRARMLPPAIRPTATHTIQDALVSFSCEPNAAANRADGQ